MKLYKVTVGEWIAQLDFYVVASNPNKAQSKTLKALYQNQYWIGREVTNIQLISSNESFKNGCLII